uniref:Uncharacterized protein n=1 Tax=Oryza rufipogon TaxID=4529 RepID=A0A0E0Q7E1_ORYRU
MCACNLLRIERHLVKTQPTAGFSPLSTTPLCNPLRPMSPIPRAITRRQGTVIPLWRRRYAPTLLIPRHQVTIAPCHQWHPQAPLPVLHRRPPDLASVCAPSSQILHSSVPLQRRDDVGTAKKAELQLVYRSFIGEISLNLRLGKFDMLINYHPMGRLTWRCIIFCWR